MWLYDWLEGVRWKLAEDDGVALLDEGLDGVTIVGGEDVG